MASSPSISSPVETPPEPAPDERQPRAARKRRFSARWLLRGLLACVCLASVVLALTQRGPAPPGSFAGIDPATAVVLVVAEGDRYGESRFHLGGIDQPELTDDAEIRSALAAQLAGNAVQSVVVAAAPGVYQREVERARRLVAEAIPQGKALTLVLVPHSAPATPQP